MKRFWWSWSFQDDIMAVFNVTTWQTGELATVWNASPAVIEKCQEGKFSIFWVCPLFVCHHIVSIVWADIARRQVADRFLSNEPWLACTSNWGTLRNVIVWLSEDLPPNIETAGVYIRLSAMSVVCRLSSASHEINLGRAFKGRKLQWFLSQLHIKILLLGSLHA